MKRLSLIITSLLIMINLSYADYHYASHTGSNTYPYTSWETAADSITSAMLAASPYDTIYIGAGEYDEIIRAGIEDSCMTFIGAGMDSTHCWTDSTVNLWVMGNNTLAQDIWFQNYTYRVCFSPYSFGYNLIAKHCKFSNGTGILATGDSVVAENCQFEGEMAIDAYFFHGKMIYRNNIFRSSETHTSVVVFGGDWTYAIIENNIFYFIGHPVAVSFSEMTEREDSSVIRNNYIDNFSNGHGMAAPVKEVVSNNTVRRIYNNNIYEDRAFTLYYHPADTGIVVLKNNSITESGIAIEADYDTFTHDSLVVQYNNFWANVRYDLHIVNWAGVDTSNNIHSYPMFANPDSFDVHLQAYSPLIDAGDPSILDVDGTRSDIGVFGGPGGTSYQYQDLPPRKPDSLFYRISEDSLIITWKMNYESDFWRYIVNRDTMEGFTPWAGNIVAEPETSFYADFHWNRSHNYYYRVAAYDNQGNLSPYSDELRIINVGIVDNSGVEVPSITTIESNYPNPFNGFTTIVYTVANLGPMPAQINIDIYDIQGRKVRNLLDQKEEVGRHTIIWNGRDDSGTELTSGIYFARITQWKVDYLGKTKKLVLVK